MMNGILRIQTYRPRQSAPVEGVTVVITGSGFTIEDVPVEEDNSLGAFGDAGDDDDYTDDSDKEEE